MYAFMYVYKHKIVVNHFFTYNSVRWNRLFIYSISIGCVHKGSKLLVSWIGMRTHNRSTDRIRQFVVSDNRAHKVPIVCETLQWQDIQRSKCLSLTSFKIWLNHLQEDSTFFGWICYWYWDIGLSVRFWNKLSKSGEATPLGLLNTRMCCPQVLAKFNVAILP